MPVLCWFGSQAATGLRLRALRNKVLENGYWVMDLRNPGLESKSQLFCLHVLSPPSGLTREVLYVEYGPVAKLGVQHAH
jgi:hypothetical protein